MIYVNWLHSEPVKICYAPSVWKGSLKISELELDKVPCITESMNQEVGLGADKVKMEQNWRCTNTGICADSKHLHEYNFKVQSGVIPMGIVVYAIRNQIGLTQD